MSKRILSITFAVVTCLAISQQPAADKVTGVSKSKARSQGQSIDEKLLFFPSKYPEGDWNPSDLSFQDVYFEAQDGTRLHGWYCPADKPRGVVLIAHGNAGHIASRAEWLKLLQSELHVSAFMFDYRGYGRSDGVPTVPGALQDARAARAKLRERAHLPDSEILLMGESLGGAIVVQLAAESRPKGLILQSTFSSMRDIADFHYRLLAWMVPKSKLDSYAAIAKYQGPLLQSHGDSDRVIPYALGQKLFGAAHEPKTFVTIAGADHNDWLTPEYLARLDDFISQVGK